MTLQTALIWGQTARPWGYEVRVDLVDPDTGQRYCECLGFASQVEAEDPVIFAARLQALQEHLAQQILAEQMPTENNY